MIRFASATMRVVAAFEFAVFFGRFKLAFCLQRRRSFHIVQRARDGARSTAVGALSMSARFFQFPLEAAMWRMKCARLTFRSSARNFCAPSMEISGILV